MLLVYYMLIINLAAFILYGIDKRKAYKGKNRISERTLIAVMVLGGVFGAVLAMLVFRHKTRKKKFQMIGAISGILYIIFICFCLYQNYHIVVTEYDIETRKQENELDGYTIVHISDLHNQFFGIRQERLIQRIRECEPDIICVTGDALDVAHTNYSLAEIFFKEAVEIAPVFYITGNHEEWLKGDRFTAFEHKIASYGVYLMDDTMINPGSISLYGISDGNLSSSTKLPSEISDSEAYSILLAHEPTYFERYSELGVDLVLTGHNHGGQIRLPGKEGLLSADFEFFPEYDAGIFESEQTTMVVSRGLGNSVLPVRINNYPEIVKIVINP